HFGWEIGSKMPRTYIDRQAIDTSMALLRERGILVGKDKKKALENPLESRKCPHCMTRNLASDKFCHDCGRALEDNLDNAISNIKMVMNEMDSEEFRKFMELWDIMKGRNTEKPLSR
ncbi:MAG: hypothetical protein KAS04_02625, partial [Candidatus Aenigmarchaeota archaeon]|nr:hypothetical protein [Candidatus Aenigmarchaeota archaeon]